jgi:flagellar biosynthesis/type III secretory pathway chaperone
MGLFLKLLGGDLVKGDIKGLISILEQEAILCEELLSTLEKERDSLRSFRAEDLVETTKEKETTLIKIRMLEESKKALIHRLSVAFHFQNEEDFSLSKISSLIPIELSSQIEILQERIKDLVIRIKKFNERNRSFLESSIKTVEESISLLVSAGKKGKHYLSTGEIAPILKNGILLNQSV